MHLLYKGALIFSQNGNKQEIILHINFEEKYYNEDKNTLENANLVALVEDSRENNNEEKDPGTNVDSSEL